MKRTYPLFARISLSEDLSDYGLLKGDLRPLLSGTRGVGQETGYSLEVFNAIGETITILVAEESMILPVQADEILQVRRLENASTL